jgi:hypothetical protein
MADTTLDRMKAVELIQLLDENVPLPYIAPTLDCALGMDDKEARRLIFAMGMRAIVEQLVEQLNEERREKDGEDKPMDNPTAGLSHGPWTGLARILGTDGDIRSVAGGGWMDVEPHERLLASGDHGRTVPGSASVVQLGAAGDREDP